ncbi:MAG: sugar phosphate isomerase/epimerase [Firmicutes bacterium]|nr:sugar phosphate isomerase/epimerase [Bacillota bacterium]
MRIGSSSYSFKRFDYGGTEGERERTLLEIIDLAPEYGLDGLELLAVQFASEDREYINELKQKAVANALDIYALSLHHDFVNPDPEIRRQQVDLVLRWLGHAEALGAPMVRVFGGRWGTVSNFTELMARNGLEDPLSGHAYEEGIEWNVEAFKQCARRAEELGIVLALENHWGLTYSAQGVLDILSGVDSPALKVALDCGNFLENMYEQLSMLVEHTALVHAKCYHGGGIFYTLDIDYPRIIRMLKDVAYNGYLSIEYEGKADPATAIPAQVQLLEQAIRMS